MIYFNNPTDTEDSRLRLTQRNLALVLDENNRLRAENEELQKAHDNRGRGLWGLVESNNRVIDAQHQRFSLAHLSEQGLFVYVAMSWAEPYAVKN